MFEQTALPHLNAAYNLARWLTRDEDHARDIVQESYLKAFRLFESYRGGDGKAWLLAIVRNTFLTWRRRTSRSFETTLSDEVERSAESHAETALDRLIDEVRVGALRNCMDHLPDEYREVLVLRELEEMSYQQIAETTNLPIGTVMSRLSRARKRLAQCVTGRMAGVRR